MKNIILTVLASLMLSCAGCSSLTSNTLPADKIQNVLTNILPPDYSGDFVFSHSNPYFHIGLTVKGLHKTADGKWTWTALEYDRGDLLNTAGKISLIPAAPPAK